MTTFKKVVTKKKKIEKDENTLREKRCVPVARKIISIIANSKYSIGEGKNIDARDYEKIALDVIGVMLENNIMYTEKNFVFQLALQAFEITRDEVLRNVEKSFDIALNKSIGKDFKELSMIDIDNILTSKS